jgi:hypothetical protein
LRFALPQGCRAISSGTARSYALTDGRLALSGSSVAGGPIDYRLTILVSGDQATGVYAVAEAVPSTCSPIVGTFTAKVGVTTPTPAPAPPAAAGPPPASTGVVGTIPAAHSAGLLVTGAASTAGELVAQIGVRGCTIASIAVLRQGAWSIYVNGAPAVVNVAFPAFLAAGTPLYLRCA